MEDINELLLIIEEMGYKSDFSGTYDFIYRKKVRSEKIDKVISLGFFNTIRLIIFEANIESDVSSKIYLYLYEIHNVLHIINATLALVEFLYIHKSNNNITLYSFDENRYNDTYETRVKFYYHSDGTFDINNY